MIRILQKFQYALRNDSKTRGQLRIMVMGIIACLVLYYTSHSILIEPKENKLNKLMAKGAEIAILSSNEQIAELGPRIVQLEHKKEVIKENIAILKIRKRFQREQWISIGNPNRFNNIIFTMSPAF